MRTVEFKPAAGGALMTAVSADTPGAANYTVKRDWRRYQGKEIKSEGDAPFMQSVIAFDYLLGIPEGPQPYDTAPITLIVSFQRPNGQRALVVGSNKQLWRYYPPGSTYMDYGYFLDVVVPGARYGGGGYFEDYSNDWVKIGDNFNGHRWEADATDGTLILNNRVDLPVSYRVEQFQAEPLAELAEQGVTSVGTIAVSNGVLLAADITTTDPITGAVTRIPYRVIWSMNDAPTRFNATIAGSITAGTRELTLAHATALFPIGQDVIVLGAGTLGGNLITTVEAINGAVLLLSGAASTTIADTPVALADTVGSIVGFFDIQDDGSAVTRILNLRGQPVVYKETAIFVGSYTGNRAAPWSFEKVYGDEEGATSETQSKCIRYRNTLIGIGGMYHVYMGRTSAYRFDLTSRTPTEIPAFEQCKDLFFQHADIKDDDFIFAASNGLTKEAFLCLPPQRFVGGDPTLLPAGIGSFNPGDRMIRFDTMFGTISTSPIEITAAATVLVGDDRLFLMARASDSALLRYGLLEKPPEMYLNDSVGGIDVTVAPNTVVIQITGGKTTSGSAVLTMPSGSVDVLQVGATVSGSGIPAGAKITVITPSFPGHITLSVPATITYTGGALVLSFVNPTTVMAVTADVFRADHLYATVMCNDANRTCFAITGYTNASHVTVKGPVATLACSGLVIIFASWLRGGAAYASELRSGLEAWGDTLREKTIGDYVLNAASGVANEATLTGPSASAPNVPVTFTFYGARSAADTPTLLGTSVITDPASGGLVPMHFQQVYTQDDLVVTGYGPFGIASRVFNVNLVNQSSIGRFKP